jgi:CheY-like chemotaxis protein
MSKPVTIIMIEDDEGHARLIERNIRRSGVNNEIIPFTNGTAAVNYLFGSDGTGLDHKGQALLILLDLNLPQGQQISQMCASGGAHHDRRFPGNQALL